MNDNVNVIWKKGDKEMPVKASHVVDEARGELLLRFLGLSKDSIDTIRYNAEKNEQTVNDYISGIVIESLQTAS